MIVESAKQYIENSDIQFSAKINIKPGFLYIDKTKIKRVWNNLINNAVKYSAKGSLITVRIDSEGNKIKFEIEDEGIGIDQDKLNKIFNIFFRCEEIDKKGYGLGLFICKSIIEAHRSNLNVKSEKGKGSTFWFYIDTD